MKLLQKTVWAYFLVTFAVIALAIPVFYFTFRSLMISTIDEDLVAVKMEIMPRLLSVINNQPAGNMDLPGYQIVYEKEPYVKEGGFCLHHRRISHPAAGLPRISKQGIV